jgi:tape measure domain-containing protein
MSNVASLSLEVKSKGLDAGLKKLDSLNESGVRLEKQLIAISRAMKFDNKDLDKTAKTVSSLSKSTVSLEKSLALLNKRLNTLEKESKKSVVSIDKSTTSTKKAKTATDSYSKSIWGASKANINMHSQAMNTNKSLGVLTTTVMFAGRAFGNFSTYTATALAALAAHHVIKTADAFTALENQLKLVSTTTKQLTGNFELLRQVSLATYSDLQSNAKLFTATDAIFKKLGMTTEDNTKFISTYQKALSLTNPTMKEAQATTIQFVQAMGSGLLRGEEFNSIMENGRGVAMMLADGLNVPIGSLREMAQAGELTSEKVITALQKMGVEIDEKFAKKTMTVSQSMQTFSTNSMVAMGELDKQLGEVISSILGLEDANGKALTSTQALARGIHKLGENLRDILEFMNEFAKVAAGGLGVYSIVKAMTKLKKNSKGTMSAMEDMAMGFVASAAEGKKLDHIIKGLTASLLALAKNPVALVFIGLATAATYAYAAMETVEDKAHTLDDILIKLYERNGTFIGDDDLGDDELKGYIDTLIVLEDKLAKIASLKGRNAKKDESLIRKQIADIRMSIAQRQEEMQLEENWQATLAQWNETAKAEETARMALEKRNAESLQSYNESALELIKKKIKLTQDQVSAEKTLASMRIWAMDIDLDLKKKLLAMHMENFELQKKQEEQNKRTAKSFDYSGAMARLELQYDNLSVSVIDAAVATAKFNAIQGGATAEQANAIGEKTRKILEHKDALEYSKEQQDAWTDSLREFHEEFAKEESDEKKELELFGEKQLDALESAKELVADFGNVWDDLGDSVASAMGEALNAFDDMHKSYDDIDEKMQALAETNQQHTEEYLALEKQKENTTLRGYSNMASAMAGMFEEGSAAQKAAHTASMAMQAIELAGEMQLAIASAVTAVAEQGKGDPYTAWARVALMAATMGSLLSNIGASISVSGSVQPSVESLPEPDGSRLGSDEASSSIVNAFDMMIDLEADQYSELRGIYSEMKELNNSLTGVMSSLYATGDLSGLGKGGTSSYSYAGKDFIDFALNNPVADFVSNIPIIGGIFDTMNGILGGAAEFLSTGLFGSTKKSTSDYGLSLGSFSLGGDADLKSYRTVRKAKDGGWFRKTKISYRDYYSQISGQSEDMLNKVFDNLRNGMIEFGDILDRDVQGQVDSFVVSIGKISTSGKSSADIQEALTNAISGQADKLAYSIFDDLVRLYGKLDESAFDTVSRLAVEKGIVEGTLSSIGQKIASDVIHATQSIIELAGGVESFVDTTNDFLELFFSDSEKQALNHKKLSEILESINIVLPATRDGYRELIEALDLTTDSGREAYVTLTALSKSADDFYSTFEKQLKNSFDNFTDGYNNILEGLLALAGAEAKLAHQRKETMDATDPLLQSHLANLWVLEDVIDVQGEYNKGLEEANSYLSGVFSTIKTFVQGLLFTGMTASVGYAQQLDLAKSGDREALSSITQSASTHLDQARIQASSLVDYNRIKMGVAKELLNLGDELTSEKFLADSFNESIAEQTAELASSLASLIDVTGQSITLEEFVSVYEGISDEEILREIFNAVDVDNNGTLTALEAATLNAEKGLNPLEAKAIEQLDALNAVYEKNELQVAGLIDLNDSVISLTDAILSMTSLFVEPTTQQSDTNSTFIGFTSSVNSTDGSHANGLMSVPFDGYRAELHRGEMVLPANQVDYLKMGAMANEIKLLRDEIKSSNTQLIANTKNSLEVLEKFDIIGMPDVRV